MAEVVGARERAPDLGVARDATRERAERLELLDDEVLVALDALEAAAREQQRLAAHDRTVRLVDGWRQDQVDLPLLVLEQHEDDALRRRGTLPCNRHPCDRDVRAVRDARELVARDA